MLLAGVFERLHHDVKEIALHLSLGAHRVELRKLDAFNALDMSQLVKIV